MGASGPKFMNEWITQFQVYLTNGHPLAYPIAYMFGFLASLTPCIYPMLPITLSFFAYLGESRKRIWPYATVYVLGMAIIYTTLGIVASLSGKIFGQFTTNPYIFFGTATVLLFSSLAMMGVIPWDPFLARFRNGNAKKDPKGFIGALVLGMTSGFIAAPCTAPVLGALLSYVALTRDIFFGGTLLFAFSIGLGTLLWFLSIFSSITKLLPKTGMWSKIVHFGMGFLMLLLSIYFFYRAVDLV